jgi:REP element-mobilizing transposase RayT
VDLEMGRKPRIIIENGVYHVISRGINEIEIFKDEDDYKHFLKILIKEKNNNDVIVLSYCLMNTHYHILIKTINPNLSKFIQILNTKYAKFFNFKYFRFGNLFINRFKSYYIDNESYLINVSRYIHLNPVEANIVKKPIDYKWSSYKEIINNERNIVDINELFSLTSTNFQTYQYYVEEIINSLLYPDFNSFYNKGNPNNYLLILEKIFGKDIFNNRYLRDIVIKYLVDNKFNLNHIAEIFNISKEHVSRIKNKTDKKLINDLNFIKHYETFIRKVPLIIE